MEYLKEYIDTISRAFTISRRTQYKDRGACVICYNDNGSIREINISSSLITRFYHRGNKRDFCPLKMYVTVITKKFKIDPTPSMQQGCYLETMLLGEGADGHTVTDLPRHKVTGAKCVVQKYIDKQASIMWPMIKEQQGIIVHKDGPYKNVQVRQKIKWKFNEYPDIEVNIYATADLISPIRGNGYEYDMAVLDVKGCGNVDSDYGEYGWSGDSLKYKDHFQLVLYHRVFDLPVGYLDFDWSKNIGYKDIPVNVNTNHPDKEKAMEARYRIKEMEETIRKTLVDIVSYEKSGWNAEPSTESCDKCPNYLCQHYKKTTEI